ncbi:MAG: hypothetical protein Q3965_03045, partial [Rothia sp. (in: high G+C Gram-positive bacteria)]|nr:hypothetical protein [Rothia sp. (in: high G+C Gram-positive bacteria)]
EQGLPYLRDVLCTVEHTLEVFRERSYLPGGRFIGCQYYILGLELVGDHAEAVRQLEYFVALHEQVEERRRSEKFVEFVRRFEARFGM